MMQPEQLAALLSRYPEIRLAILFGSMATGRTRADSDIDLGLLAQAPLTAGLTLQLTQAIGVEFGRPVDIVDLYHVPEPITGQVLKGIRLYGDNATYARLLTRHLLNVADFLPLHQRILTERRNKWIS
ncbi:MAG: nucleotidyltransferase domain-containing protein [Pseudomonadota bacterium]